MGKRASDMRTLVIRPSGGDHRERAILNEKKRVESMSDECRADPLLFISLIDGNDMDDAYWVHQEALALQHGA